ncbi:MAG: hypothetical protein NZ898_01555 [Myxococcota bacterium]|nr:hypothetical protein [Myxococcota bacterium]
MASISKRFGKWSAAPRSSRCSEAPSRARNGATGALEEDARLTALFLWTLQATNGEQPETSGATEEEEDDEASDEDEDDAESPRGAAKGYTLAFDVVRRFAQPLGIDLARWEGRVIETRKGLVRLLPVAERANQLFGDAGADRLAAMLEQQAWAARQPQLALFGDDGAAAPEVGRGDRRQGERTARAGRARRPAAEPAARREPTTLDRVHAAMLLQAGGQAQALRALIGAEQERGPDFLRLANALSALYPKESEEKRLLDAMLLAVPR